MLACIYNDAILYIVKGVAPMPKSISDDQILDAVVETLSARGYDGATTRQIAADADVNEVTLFRRFGTKAELLAAAMQRELVRFEGQGGAEYTGDVTSDLRTVVSLYRQLLQRHARLVPVLLIEFRRRPELAEVAGIALRVVHSVAGLLLRYQSEGVLAKESPAQAASCLLGPVFVLGLAGGSGVPAPAGTFCVEEHVARFIAGRRPSPDRTKG